MASLPWLHQRRYEAGSFDLALGSRYPWHHCRGCIKGGAQDQVLVRANLDIHGITAVVASKVFRGPGGPAAVCADIHGITAVVASKVAVVSTAAQASWPHISMASLPWLHQRCLSSALYPGNGSPISMASLPWLHQRTARSIIAETLISDIHGITAVVASKGHHQHHAQGGMAHDIHGITAVVASKVATSRYVSVRNEGYRGTPA